MARVGRLAGAILVESEGRYFLVGNTKEPCDFSAVGFVPPAEIDALRRPFLPLEATRPVELSGPTLVVEMEGEALAKTLGERFLIERNGSVSERLWRLVFDPEEGGEVSGEQARDARWLCEMPFPVWRVVRDTVLRCS